MDEKAWRKAIDSLRAETLPEDGSSAPDIETIKVEEPKKEGNKKVFVQKVVTSVYIYTDVDEHIFGQQAFQHLEILGEMTVEKMIKILNKEVEKREEQG